MRAATAMAMLTRGASGVSTRAMPTTAWATTATAASFSPLDPTRAAQVRALGEKRKRRQQDGRRQRESEPCCSATGVSRPSVPIAITLAAGGSWGVAGTGPRDRRTPFVQPSSLDVLPAEVAERCEIGPPNEARPSRSATLDFERGVRSALRSECCPHRPAYLSDPGGI